MYQATFKDECAISRIFPIAWPAELPDLKRLNVLVWGFHRDRVYQVRVTNEVDMKGRIVRHVSLILTGMFRAAVDIVDHQCMNIEHAV